MDTVNVKECVRFKHIPIEFLDLWETLFLAAKDQGKVATITGASYENYPKGSYHEKGYAWDVRVTDIPDPFLYACTIRSLLVKIDERWRVVYGDSNHTDHIHIEFRFDMKISKRTEE